MTGQSLISLFVAMPQRLVLGAIWCYQKTKNLRPRSCRFYPSCSEYMSGSVRRFGVLAGLTLGLGRLLKCHPGHDGGIDEVPQTLKWLEKRGQIRPEVASES